MVVVISIPLGAEIILQIVSLFTIPSTPDNRFKFKMQYIGKILCNGNIVNSYR